MSYVVVGLSPVADALVFIFNVIIAWILEQIRILVSTMKTLLLFLNVESFV